MDCFLSVKVAVPDVGLSPDQAPLATQPLAPVDDQLMVYDSWIETIEGDADMVIVGQAPPVVDEPTVKVSALEAPFAFVTETL